MSNWLRLLIYALPIALVVWEQCRKMSLSPVLPIAGLIVGVVAELNRG